MIIKGGSRGGPAQLARHLQRRDTNDTVEILEFQSAAPTLAEAFRDWQTLSEGTRGYKGLYHANIDPAEDYVMTREQWLRAVEVLEKELGLEGQPRAVVMHEKHGREHIHVVWARTDIDEMILRSDSMNYLAHERASQALELEFGHEQVPGKHAKRDREKQPEFPEAEYNQAEWQQQERTGLGATARKDQITALKQASDSAEAFKAALEDQGYILAWGRRGYVVVDQTGAVHSLVRQIHGMNSDEVREFMKSVGPESLPTAEQAKMLQRELQQERQKELMPPRDAEATTPPDADALKAEAEAIRKAHAERQAAEARKLEEIHLAEQNKLREQQDRNMRERLELHAAEQRREANLLRERQETRSPFGLAGLWASVQDALDPSRVAAREAAHRLEQEQLAKRQQEERAEQSVISAKITKLERDNLAERQQQAVRDHALKAEKELERRLRELDAAHRLRREVEASEQQREESLRREQESKQKTSVAKPDPETTALFDPRGKTLEELQHVLPARQAQEVQKWLDAEAEAFKAREQELERVRQKKADEFAAAQEKEMATLRAKLTPNRQQKIEDLERQQALDARMNDLALTGEKESALREFQERQAEERRPLTEKVTKDVERRLREEEAVRKLREEVEEIERRQREEELKNGPDPPKHTL